jgi:DNA-binding Xre family transcriptional regulator
MGRRRLNFHWHLRRLMAAHDLWKTTQLAPLLRERGIELSETQVFRLVTDKPERLSMRTLVALCDIFECSPADLIEPYVESSARTQKAEGAGVVDMQPNFRPERARIVDDE